MDRATLVKNAAQLDSLVSQFSSCKCANCEIPLDGTKALNRIAFIGDVCELCWYLHAAVNRPWFIAHQKAWETENKRRSDIIRKRTD